MINLDEDLLHQKSKIIIIMKVEWWQLRKAFSSFYFSMYPVHKMYIDSQFDVSSTQTHTHHLIHVCLYTPVIKHLLNIIFCGQFFCYHIRSIDKWLWLVALFKIGENAFWVYRSVAFNLQLNENMSENTFLECVTLCTCPFIHSKCLSTILALP